jgi:NAD(P)-dependent dehydrogenase (short-subunit alcohol dehydrogenase family)
MKTVGLIGAGHIGSQLARLAVRHGYDVLVSNSRGPETLQELVGELGQRARDGTLDVVDIGPRATVGAFNAIPRATGRAEQPKNFAATSLPRSGRCVPDGARTHPTWRAMHGEAEGTGRPRSRGSAD